MKGTDISKAIKILKQEIKKWNQPIVTEVSNKTRSPFQVLISCILSLRTKDATTAGASYRLFELASTADEMRRLDVKKIERAIYPVGFYRTKAKNTKTPEETEFALRKRLPKKYWKIINDLLVTYGQNLCKPISPHCSECRIYRYCRRVGGGRRR